jgi:hypothetical protein
MSYTNIQHTSPFNKSFISCLTALAGISDLQKKIFFKTVQNSKSFQHFPLYQTCTKTHTQSWSCRNKKPSTFLRHFNEIIKKKSLEKLSPHPKRENINLKIFNFVFDPDDDTHHHAGCSLEYMMRDGIIQDVAKKYRVLGIIHNKICSTS